MTRWVTPASRTSRPSGAPPRAASSGGVTRQAPLARVMAISPTATSKPKALALETRLVSSISKAAAADTAKLASERCSTTTPLGWPVVPEV